MKVSSTRARKGHFEFRLCVKAGFQRLQTFNLLSMYLYQVIVYVFCVSFLSLSFTPLFWGLVVFTKCKNDGKQDTKHNCFALVNLIG